MSGTIQGAPDPARSPEPDQPRDSAPVSRPAEDATADYHTPTEMSRRKAQHLEICVDDERYAVESGRNRLGEVHLIHRSLPEVDAAAVDTSWEFLSHRVSMPLFISSMTGGSSEGYRTNKDLATIAQLLGIPVGMGSIRILFRKPEVIDDFLLKQFAPDVPVFANIGGVQLPEMDHREIFEMIRRLEVDGIAVHLNPGQELFQPGGDRDFRGIADAVARFVDGSPVPVIVKETGFGINPDEVRRLREAGAHYVDIAGSGGTNWVRVEAYRQDDTVAAAAASEFDEWGLPVALVLATLGRNVPGVLASGGMRSGMDAVRAVAMGAEGVGMALPFVRALRTAGIDGAVDFGRRVQYVMETALALAGCRTLDELRRAPLWVEERLKADAAALAQAQSEAREALDETR
jgi:isopentenyl-diphosphate delta-isomerase